MISRQLIGLTFTLAVVAFGCWQLSIDDPILPYVASGILLFLAGAIAGLRFGYESAVRFIEDAARMNKLVADQNSDLVELNRRLLAKHLSECGSAQEPSGQPSTES